MNWFNLSLSLFILFVFDSFMLVETKNHSISKTDYRLKLTNFVCHADNNFIVNLTCFIKAARGKAGYLTMKSIIRKPLNNFNVELRHFFKPVIGRNPQFRPYLYNMDVNWCDLMAKKGGNNILITAILDFIVRAFKADVIFRKCPLVGIWASENVDLDRVYEMSDMYGQALPEGDHKFAVRLRSAANYTYQTFSLVLNCKGNHGFDLSMLSMG